ncbi:MAG: DUF3853 family protein [Bacteroidales bacterium]
MQTEQVLFSLPLDKLEPIFKKWFKEIIDISPTNQPTTTPDPEPLIFGVNGLAKFLHVSTVTSQKIKNSGKIPFSQVERTIIFKKEDVLKALSNKKK